MPYLLSKSAENAETPTEVSTDTESCKTPTSTPGDDVSLLQVSLAPEGAPRRFHPHLLKPDDSKQTQTAFDAWNCEFCVWT